MLRFFALFVALQALLFGLELTPFAQAHFVEPWTAALARISSWFATLFDPGVVADGRVMRSASSAFAVSIEAGCNGVEATIVLIAGASTQKLHLPGDAPGWAGLVLLTIFYCIAMSSLFFVLPRLSAASTVALNFEPIAALVLAWVFLGQVIAPLQVAGALVTVGAIAWLGVKK